MVRGLAHITVIAVLLAASTALAQPASPDPPDDIPLRVAVEQVEGPTRLARGVRLALVRSLLEAATVIPVADLERARSAVAAAATTGETSEEGADDPRVAAIARAIEADGIVSGAITGRRAERTIELVIRAGWSGAVVATRSIPLPRRYIGKVQKKAIREATLGLLSGLQDAKRERAPAARQAEAENLAGQPALATGSGSATGSVAAVGPRSSDRPFWRDLHGSVTLGWSFLSRDLDFSVADGIPQPLQPFRYERGLASGLALGAEVYPLGSLTVLGGHLAPLGLRFAFERTLGLRSELAESPGETFGTVQQHWSLGLVYARTVHVGRPLAITGGLGFDRLSHSIALDDPGILLPDVTYSSLDLAIRVQVPVLQRLGPAIPDLAAYVETSLLLGLGAGDIEAMESYGESSLIGVDLDLGAEFAPPASWPVPAALRVRLGLRYIRMGLGFDGSGALTELDGDGEPDVESASDSYLGGYLAAGYTF